MNETVAKTGEKLPDAPRARIAAPELLRFVAASMVCLLHFEQLMGIEYRLFGDCYLVVDMFFMLTGFYMMLSAFKKQSQPVRAGEAFLNSFNKAKSIYFPYFLALVTTFIIKTIQDGLTASEAAQSLFHYKWEFFYLQMLGFNPNPQFNVDYLLGPGWYLSAMFIALIPAYYLARKHTKVFAGVIAPLSAAAVYCLEINVYGTLDAGNEMLYIVMVGVLRAFAGISAGAFAALIFRILKTRTMTKRFRVGLSLIEALCCALVFCMVLLTDLLSAADMIMYIFVFAALIITFNLNETWIARALNGHGTRVWLLLGRLSLYMYLFHWPLLMIFGSSLSVFGTVGAYFVAFIGIILVSYLIMKLDDLRKNRKSLRAAG